jgi:hypothetical protein
MVHEAEARLALKAPRFGVDLGLREAREARVVLRFGNARIPDASLRTAGARDDVEEGANRDHDQDGASHFRRFSLFVGHVERGMAAAHAARSAMPRK